MGLLQRGGAVAGTEAEGVGGPAEGVERAGFLQAGLAQIRQGSSRNRIRPILQER